MLRALLTLWYTLTVLVGPALCCCTSRALAPAPAAAQVAKPVKNCCGSTREHEGCDPAPAPARDPGPSHCPCKHQQKQDVDRLALSASPALEAVGKSRTFDAVWADTAVLPQDSELLRPNGRGLDPAGGPARVAGRTLLAAYQILRC